MSTVSVDSCFCDTLGDVEKLTAMVMKCDTPTYVFAGVCAGTSARAHDYSGALTNYAIDRSGMLGLRKAILNLPGAGNVSAPKECDSRNGAPNAHRVESQMRSVE